MCRTGIDTRTFFEVVRHQTHKLLRRALAWHNLVGVRGRQSRPRTPTTGEVWRGRRPLQTSPQIIFRV